MLDSLHVSFYLCFYHSRARSANLFFFLRAGLQGFNYSLARVLCILNNERPQNSHEMNSNLRVCTAVRLRCRVQVVCEV